MRPIWGCRTLSNIFKAMGVMVVMSTEGATAKRESMPSSCRESLCPPFPRRRGKVAGDAYFH